MPQEGKQVNFRCDPQVYREFVEVLRKKSPTATVSVTAELIDYMKSVAANSGISTTITVAREKSIKYDSSHVARAGAYAAEAARSLARVIEELSADESDHGTTGSNQPEPNKPQKPLPSSADEQKFSRLKDSFDKNIRGVLGDETEIQEGEKRTGGGAGIPHRKASRKRA